VYSLPAGIGWRPCACSAGQRSRPWWSTCGNPSGRPKNRLTDALRAAATDERSRQLAEKLWSMALRGNLQAISILLDRLEGKAVARQEQGTPGDFRWLDEFSTEALKETLKIIQGGLKDGPKGNANGEGE